MISIDVSGWSSERLEKYDRIDNLIKQAKDYKESLSVSAGKKKIIKLIGEITPKEQKQIERDERERQIAVQADKWKIKNRDKVRQHNRTYNRKQKEKQIVQEAFINSKLFKSLYHAQDLRKTGLYETSFIVLRRECDDGTPLPEPVLIPSNSQILDK